MNKVIRNEANYEETLSVLENLMDRNPTTGTDESDELELLTLLIQDYESRQYQFVPRIQLRPSSSEWSNRSLLPET
jgi:hypothetical protein